MNADAYSLIFFLAMVVLCGGVLLAISAIFGRKRAGVKPFECGVDGGAARIGPFHVRFFPIAIIFLVFSAGATLILPWAAAFRQQVSEGAGWLMATELVVFIALFALALVFAIASGAIESGETGEKSER